MAQEIMYLGWTIYRWDKAKYGIWYPNGDNTGKQYPSLAKAKEHIRIIEENCKRDYPDSITRLLVSK